MAIRLFGIFDGSLGSWTASKDWMGGTAKEYAASFASQVFIAYDDNAPETMPVSDDERVAAIFEAFDRGDWFGDRTEAIRAYNDWAIYRNYSMYGVNAQFRAAQIQLMPGPRKPQPQLTVEVHADKSKFDSDAAWKAIRDLSKGS